MMVMLMIVVMAAAGAVLVMVMVMLMVMIVMAGMNKVAANVDEALSRVHGTATPMNCKRLGKNTPCSATGVCSDCLSPDCICNQVVITRRSGIEGRIKVILIGEELGY